MVSGGQESRRADRDEETLGRGVPGKHRAIPARKVWGVPAHQRQSCDQIGSPLTLWKWLCSSLSSKWPSGGAQAQAQVRIQPEVCSRQFGRVLTKGRPYWHPDIQLPDSATMRRCQG
ncbi:uncharacterized protein LOC144338017 [Macaca mulatta]